ncbi:MAG: transglutaminase domain-containing protein, partial [Kofleriaceae bacterium]
TGVILKRVETLRFLRGDAPISLATTIEIDADSALIPRRVSWTERGAQVRSASARHDAGGWFVEDRAPAIDPRQRTRLETSNDAIPAELAPLYVRRDGRFAGDIFLPARGFVGGRGRIDAVAPGRLVARLELGLADEVIAHDDRTAAAHDDDHAAHDDRTAQEDRTASETLTRVTAEATIDLARDGMPARVVDGEGVIAIRASEQEARESFPLVDLVAATSIALSGERGPRARLALVGDIALPPLPGQAAITRAAGLEVELSTRLPGALAAGPRGDDRTSEIAALVARVQQRIAPDLGASIATPGDASDATAGDCTTFALAYAAVAQRAQIPTRVVTGLRVDHAADGERLARHRWAVSWTGTRWIAVDAAFGRVPAGGDLVGLAVHDADDAGLIAGEAALTQVRAAAWTR